MNYVNIDLDYGLSPEQRQASIQSRAEESFQSRSQICSDTKDINIVQHATLGKGICFQDPAVKLDGLSIMYWINLDQNKWK